MNIFSMTKNAISCFFGFREFESQSDEMILRVTKIDPQLIPKLWRDEARVVIKDLYRTTSGKINLASACMIKLAVYCHGFEVNEDNDNRHKLASAIRKLRCSYEGAEISTEASQFSYTFVNA